MNVLVLSSTPFPEFASMSDAEFFRHSPYSLGAIFYHLSLRGRKVLRLGRPFTRPAGLLALARRIDEFRPDVVYTYGAPAGLPPIICRRLFCRHKNFRVIHGWDDRYGDLFRCENLLLAKAFDLLEKLIVTRSDAVVTLSYLLQNIAREWNVECKYIPNGADPIDRSAARGKIKLEGNFKLVYTGDQAPWKRTAELCAAMKHLPADIKLYLTGRHYAYLDKFAADNCIFLGWLSKEEQFNVMSQADIFVCTSDQDCNAKIQEYLRWERPYLGYDGVANLFFKNGVDALLTTDYESAILRLCKDPDFRAKLVANARAIPVFSWAEIAEKFDEFFNSQIKQLSKQTARK